MSTWIFLRGLTRESRHWGNFPKEFLQEVPGAEIHTPDLPGTGTQNTRKSPILVDAIAECIRARLFGQGVLPPYHVLAMSLGAMVAISWASRHPDEIRGCVLINTSLRPFNPFYQRLKPGSYRRLLKLALLGANEQDWESAILDLTSRHAGRPAEVLGNWITYRRDYPVSRRNALRQSCSRQLAFHWHTAFAQHPTAGHDLPLDDGLWVARQVKHWLQTPPPPLA